MSGPNSPPNDDESTDEAPVDFEKAASGGVLYWLYKEIFENSEVNDGKRD